MSKRIAGGIALAAASAVMVAACSSSHTGSTGGNGGNGGNTGTSNSVPGSTGTVPTAASGAQTAGTITWAEQPNSEPSWILPITASGQNSVFNLFTFSWELWRPTYWTVQGVTATMDPSMSLANQPVWTNGDKTVSISFKSNYKWSDGSPITADDLLFDIDLIKAAIKASPANWSGYVPGNFPDNLVSESEPNPETLVLNLKSAVNPAFFTDDILGQGPTNPLPVQTWARDSVNGPVVTDWKTNPADDLKIYNFLVAQNKSVSTYATNPLWKTVDGPYELSDFNATTGGYTLTPNPTYGGPEAKKVSTFQAVPFTSDAAEYNAIKAQSIDVAQVPLEDAPQLNQVKLLGYQYFGEADFGMNFAVWNFKDKTGDFSNIVDKLYFRQAMEHLEDEPGWIHDFFNGYGSQAYGPVPQYPISPDAPADAESNPYPFSVSAATTLLKDNGWTINAGGTDTCSKPGTGPGECGEGIPAGTPLSFNYIVSTAPALIAEQATDLVSQANKAGIHISMQTSNFDYMLQNYVDPGAPANENKWALEDFGGESENPVATTFGLFNTTGLNQIGDYSNPTADSLINASVTSGDPSAVKNEASFLTLNLPAMFQPNPDLIWAWKSDISGPPDTFENLTQYYATPEFWYFTK